MASRHPLRRPTAAAAAILLAQLLASPVRATEGSPGAQPAPTESRGTLNAGTEAQPTHRIAAVSGLRLLAAPEPDAPLIATLPVGEILTVIERSQAPSRVGDLQEYWYQVHTGPEPSGGTSGWVFGALTLPFDPSNPDATYRTLLERRIAAGQKRTWADDLDLLMLVARHLKPAPPSESIRALAGPAIDRIGESLKTACRYGQGGPGTLQAAPLVSELQGLRSAWPETTDRDGQEPWEPELLQRAEGMVRDCAAWQLRTLFEQEALGGLAVGMTGREAERTAKCRFRRYPPETNGPGDTFVRSESKDCGIELQIIVDEGNDADTGTVTDILLTKPFKGRTRLGIGIGSTQEELIAAYGRYSPDPKDPPFGVSGESVCEDGAHMGAEIKDGRIAAIDLAWGFCD